MIEYKFPTESKLPDRIIKKVIQLEEYANGATQATVELENGQVYNEVLISNASVIIAIRGFHKLPFEIGDIKNIYQTVNDFAPIKRDGWEYF